MITLNGFVPTKVFYFPFPFAHFLDVRNCQFLRSIIWLLYISATLMVNPQWNNPKIPISLAQKLGESLINCMITLHSSFFLSQTHDTMAFSIMTVRILLPHMGKHRGSFMEEAPAPYRGPALMTNTRWLTFTSPSLLHLYPDLREKCQHDSNGSEINTNKIVWWRNVTRVGAGKCLLFMLLLQHWWNDINSITLSEWYELKSC